MAGASLILRDIELTFGGTPLLERAELTVSAGDRVALVGRNGSGKSTLLKIAAGLIEADAGERFLHPGLTVRYLPQEPDLGGFASALDYVLAGLGPGDDPYRAQALLSSLGLRGDETPGHLSGGEARRCALARVLAPEPDVLFLDEPTNHLDLPAIEWLESELASLRSALVLISHDRRFLETLSRATVWLHEGRTHRLEHGFGAFESWRDEFLEQEAVEQHKLDRKLAKETDWLRKGVTARRKRNQGRLRALHELRATRRDRREAPGSVVLSATAAAVSGKLVIEADGVSKSFDGRPVVQGLSVRVQRGDRIGIVGPNGAGKTTLVNLLTGTLAPDEGTVRLGSNLHVATLDQGRGSLNPDMPLADVLTGGAGDSVTVGGELRHVVSYMKSFLFTPVQARTPVRALSGGERGRLVLARALAQPSNLLVLDEPTNDLDIETLDLLQEMLADYAGTVLLVSHDRDFLDRVVTLTLASDGSGAWQVYGGGYSDMLAQGGKPWRQQSADSESVEKVEKKPEQQQSGPTPARKKLSFNEKRALETLPKRISELEAEIKRLKVSLSDSGLYQRDPAAFESTATALSQAEQGLAQAEEDWLALEIKREGLNRD